MAILSARRFPDWEARLGAYLERLHHVRFEWGRCDDTKIIRDCCTFTGGGVEAMTGADPMPEFRGRYSTRIGSLRALRRYGAGDLASTLDTKFEAVMPSLAQRGDIVMSNGLLGICLGAQLVAVGREGDREGLVLFARPTWTEPRAWRVQYGF